MGVRVRVNVVVVVVVVASVVVVPVLVRVRIKLRVQVAVAVFDGTSVRAAELVVPRVAMILCRRGFLMLKINRVCWRGGKRGAKRLARS